MGDLRQDYGKVTTMGQQGTGAILERTVGLDLEEFVTETILAVCRGIRAAADRVSQIDRTAIVNPRSESEQQAQPENLSFDIALAVSMASADGQGVGAKITVPFTSTSAGPDQSPEYGIQSVSRIRFNVPVSLPSRTDLRGDTSDRSDNRWEV